MRLNESILKNLNEETENSGDTETQIYNLFIEVAKDIEGKYDIDDLVSKLNTSDLKMSGYLEKPTASLRVDYMTVPFLNCPLTIDFEYSGIDNKFKVRASLSNPDSTSFWSGVMKGRTLASGRFIDNKIIYYKDR